MISKAKLYERLRGQLNPRQEKVLARLLCEDPEGFIGGLSAEKYIGITRATATRDLQDLVGKGALLRRGNANIRVIYLILKPIASVLIPPNFIACPHRVGLYYEYSPSINP
ncbi:MAG: hypothetical protein WC782_14405 [Methylococcaceae bacterium]